MIDRFLRYSLESGRSVCLFVNDAKGLRRINVHVLEIREDAVQCRTGQKGRPFSLPLSDILSAGYARGDEGDTLKNEMERILNDQ
ncbi:MAG: hypothetical protein MJ136_00545 [Clostridia bacterium]|nr:hypothetical protein [Clostridia bacterium]